MGEAFRTSLIVRGFGAALLAATAFGSFGKGERRGEHSSCKLPLHALELQLGKPCVKAARGGEPLMRAFFDNTALIHHDDAVTG